MRWARHDKAHHKPAQPHTPTMKPAPQLHREDLAQSSQRTHSRSHANFPSNSVGWQQPQQQQQHQRSGRETDATAAILPATPLLSGALQQMCDSQCASPVPVKLDTLTHASRLFRDATHSETVVVVCGTWLTSD